jgi:peptidoglycan/xylan/chitin deacetylase (PgdA/CDA1 family)
VSRRAFRRQLAWLQRCGYRPLGLDELLRARHEHRLPVGRSVVVTFDDGYRDNYQRACPVLRHYGFMATFFIVTGFVGGVNAWDRDGALVGRALLSWPDIRALLALGMQVGGHTRHHPRLTEIEPELARAEVAGSRHDLEQRLGQSIASFAYPHGRYDPATIEAVVDAGFTGACCSDGGPNDPAVPIFQLRRLEVRGSDSLLQFMLGVRSGFRLSPGRLIRYLWRSR